MSETSTQADAAPPSRRRGRAVTSMALIVIVSILLPLAGVTVWVRNLVLDSPRYVDTVAPLSKNEAIREAVAIRVSTEVIDALDVRRRAQEALPKRAKFLAAPIATGAQELVRSTTLRLLETDTFDKVWRLANENAHDQIVVALTGEEKGAITTNDGKVVLNLGPLAAGVARQLGSLGIGVPKNLDVSRLNVRFVLIASDDLKSVQTYARVLDKLSWILPLITFLLYAVAVFLAANRRRALMRVGVGVMIAMGVSIVGFGFARSTYLDNLPDTVQSPAAAAAIFDTVTRFVERGIRALLVIGLLVWLGAWLSGPSKPAVTVRRQWNLMTGRAGMGLSSAVEIGPVNRWVAANATGLRFAVGGVILGLLWIWDHPGGLTILFLGVLLVAGLGVIQVLGAGAKTEVQEASESTA